MNTPEAAETVEELLAKIRRATKGGNYIFRGENKDYGKVSSKLRRYFQTIVGRAELQQTAPILDFKPIKQELENQLDKDVQKIDFSAIEKSLKENILDQLAQKGDYSLMVGDIQEDFILKDVQGHVDFENKIDTLAELQHYGGSTNLIDFSQDLAVALFFACDGEPEEDGRLILLRANAEGVIPPKKNQNNRIVFQKSVFVQRDDGYIEENEIGQFIVSKNLKPLLLTYVQDYFNIRTETIYGDLMGYIQKQEMHSEAYKQFFAGVFYHNKIRLKEAIICFTKAINLKPNLADAYNSRGHVKTDLTPPDFKGAMVDYNKAIDLNPSYPFPYLNRGNVYSRNKKYDLAIAEYNKAIALDMNYALAYRNRGLVYNNKGKYALAIADFDEAIKLDPDDIAIHVSRSVAKKALWSAKQKKLPNDSDS